MSVSVITPSYNRKEFLKETIQSVISQTYANWEHIIVDDGSSQDLIDMVADFSLQDSRIRLIKNSTGRKGASVCRNIGCKNAKGEHIVFLDSDDLLAPFCLQQRYEVMQGCPDLDFAVFPMLIFDIEPEKAKYLWNVTNDSDDLRRFLQLDAVWQTTGPIWKKRSLLKINGFNEELHCWQDLDLHTRALLARLSYQKFYDLKPDCFYRRHGNESISQQRINTPDKLDSRGLFFSNVIEELKTSSQIEQFRNELKSLLIGLLISASRTLNRDFFNRWIKKERTKDLIDLGTRLYLIFIWSLYNLRINRVALVNKTIVNFKNKYQFSSIIGKTKIE